MKRFQLAFVSLFLGLMHPCGIQAAKPNIILIMADDLGYECLGANGSTSYKTPRLDALAKTGLRFVHCYSQPLCTPSRVQIMTGRYNDRNYSDFGYLPPSETTFAHMVKQEGYATLIAGKWQLNGITRRRQGFRDKTRPFDAGFDEFCLWQVDQLKGKGERYADPLIVQNGETLPRDSNAYGPDIFCHYILDFIDRHQTQPFFVYYPMVLTHDPFVPTPDSPEWHTARQAKNDRYFAHMVNYMDKIVGQIADHLNEQGLAENTLLMFTGDNGTHRRLVTQTATGSVQGGKGTMLNAGTHVPFVVSWKGHTPQGRVNDDLIDFSDFFPTICDAAGVDLPADLMLDGQSFLPQLKGEIGNPRNTVFCHYDPRWGNFSQWRGRFARDKQFKLYMDGRFYNVVEDELEKAVIHPTQVSPWEISRKQRLQAALNKKAFRH